MTTRRSDPDRSRGLIACQESKTPRRMRSPSPSEMSAATRVIAAQARTTRRPGRLPSNTDFEPVIGAQDFQWRTASSQFFVADAFLVHPLDIFVQIGRLVMEQ